MGNKVDRRSILLAGVATGVAAPIRAMTDRRAVPTARTGVPLEAAGSRFLATVRDGAIVSLRCRGDRHPTDYVRAGAGLGRVRARWRSGTEDWQWLDTGPGGTGSHAASDGPTLSSTFAIEGETLCWDVLVDNRGRAPAEIGDLVVPLPMPTRFLADRPATEAVLKHSLVAGHGSRIFWMRSNSVGPYLIMLPDRDTHLEYWDVQPLDGDDPSTWCAYIHAGARSAETAARGTRWRQPTTTLRMAAGERRRYRFRFAWVADYAAARDLLARSGSVDVEVVPGMTVPSDLHADLSVASADRVVAVEPEFPAETTVERLPDRAGRQRWRVRFARLGENRLTLRQPGGRSMPLEFFSTEPLETMIAKRAAFIVRRQHRDPSRWYDGLFGEWNMATGTLLGPDNYDRIRGWRIYEVTCDDPGLSKPAYLAGKLAEHPVAEEVAALDHYIERFVWGGLQRTTAETHPYGIYGIPDWRQNRASADPGDKGRLHIWRPYDYPHIVAMYWGMYRVARDHPAIPTRLDARAYLDRAYGTALAMFTVPMRVVGWSAYDTGFYNECVIPDLIEALDAAGSAAQAATLRSHWMRKVARFVSGEVDLFGSEYPFDSTGFESTQALARTALDTPAEAGIAAAAAKAFARRQFDANLFCRGWLEPAYYYLGSDYRAGAGDGFTLTYMAQMGGWAVLDHALNDASDPHPLLRLGYASQLSAWALLNSGTPQGGYGYWYPGPEHDGACGGGFEPAPEGTTWLEQPHHRGSWYYSCEADLGYCGALRAARTVIADDPLFGRTCYGGTLLADTGAVVRIVPRDGVRRRLGARLAHGSIDVELLDGRFARDAAVEIDAGARQVRFTAEPFAADAGHLRVKARRGRAAWAVATVAIRGGRCVVDV